MGAATKRDYSILGPEKEVAMAKGLVAAEWYQSPIPRKRMKELMTRRNGPAARDAILWLAILGALGYLAYLSWGTWWAIPAFAAYGTYYSVTATSKWHEHCHGTPFKTAWLNEAMYQFCALLILSPATGFRWSHVRHHTDTYIVGSDTEIAEPRPPVWKRIIRSIVKIQDIYFALRSLFEKACGRLNATEKDYIPESEHRKLIREARVFLLFCAAAIALCFAVGSILPLMFVGLPAFYGFVLMAILNYTQHMGLYEDQLDHRLCCRTFYTNPILRFMYTNMNYHAEHHMYPMVPYYNLPALHEEIKQDCPAAAPSFFAAVRETFHALWLERRDPAYIVPRYREFAEGMHRQ